MPPKIIENLNERGDGVKIDVLFFVSMKDTHFGQMNQGVAKTVSKRGVNKGLGGGGNKGVNKGVSKVGGGDGGVGVGGEGGGIRADVVEQSVLRIIDDYKPFLDSNYHHVFHSFPSNHIPFIHFLIFLIWFASPFQFPIQLFDLFSLFLHFKGFPFHSFLFHIKQRGSNSDISGNIG